LPAGNERASRPRSTLHSALQGQLKKSE